MKSSFQTTRWTLVVRATEADVELRREALSELLSQNWYPLYTFLRRSGKRVDEIEDLVQGFYLRIIENDLLAGIEQHRKASWLSD